MGKESPDERTDGGSAWSPERCLSVTVRGPWGHFRRVEGNVVKQTYRIIPRTTVAGLLAAVLGIDRNSYYDLFGPDSSRIAIEPVSALRTLNMPMNTLSTAAGDLRSINSQGKLALKLPDPTNLRQQHNYEVLVDPAYRIDVALSDEKNITASARRSQRGNLTTFRASVSPNTSPSSTFMVNSRFGTDRPGTR